ncbi:MAG TPA: 2-dehydropantoate 2-reductase [Steroidobacteraceae bacterium]|jgi:2-dehydropantoate 2-reductase|nr:2-dehydropantoate 2-reductase [Steroidobacteraceae bacterium]
MAVRMLIVGAGAVGGYFGGRLAQAGRDVSFLVRPSRAQQLRQGGLRILSPHGDAQLTPQLLSRGQIDTHYDLILLSVKAYGLESAMEDFAPAVGETTAILPLLNGMRHIDELVRRFGTDRVLGGVCRIAARIDPEGRIVQMADFQELLYGERAGATTPRLQAIDATLSGAGFDAHICTDITQAMWDKWVQLASLGAATCLLRGTIGQIVAAPGGAALSLQILDECVAIAAACGHEPSASFLSAHARALSAPGSAMTSSMYRDLLQGAPVEADHILGDLIERGAVHGSVTPLLKAAGVTLRIYQDARSRRA